MALAGGGFDLASRHIAGIFAWIAVAVLVATGYSKVFPTRFAYRLVALILVGLAALTLLSTLWSSSVASTLVEFERIVAYLGFFTLGFLVCGTETRRRLFVDGLLLTLALILLLALADRLFPGTGIPTELESSRLGFPLGYWNANGLLFGASVIAFAWASRNASWNVVRWISVGLVPAAAVGMYLTYSRGGALAGVVGLVCIFFLSRDRLWITSVVGIGVLFSIPVISVIQKNSTIADNLGGPDAPHEGRMVLLALVVAILAAMGSFAVLRTVARRAPRLAGTLLGISRDHRFLKGVAGLGATALATLAILFGGHVWNQFSGADIYFPESPEEHFTQLSGAGRYEFNQVAIDTFTSNPLLGTGAGTYKYEWAQHRPIGLVAQDAHSIYLEAFAELGLVGGMLIIALTVSVIWLCTAFWRRGSQIDRQYLSIVIPLVAILLVGFGIDWFWELAATAALLMLLCGWLAAGLQKKDSSLAPQLWTKVTVGVVAWVVVILLAVPTISDRYMESSIKATDDGRIPEAIQSARSASKFNPFWSRPHMQLGVLAQYLGDEERARREFSKAIDLEPDNWQTWYLRSLAKREAGQTGAADSDLSEARLRNPRTPELQDPQPSAVP